MNYEIKQEDKRTVAGFHLVGPWEQTVIHYGVSVCVPISH